MEGGGCSSTPGLQIRRWHASLSGPTREASSPPFQSQGARLVLTLPLRKTAGIMFPPETHSVHSNIGTSPNTDPPLLPSLLQGGAGQPIRHSQCTMLTSDRFVKYQCICCSGDVPKHHAPYARFIHTFYASFFFVSLIENLFPSPTRSMILSSCCDSQPSEHPSP